ncbi:sulfite exporter TauE/SafE family protein [Bradyrhizobium sp. CSS354]|uniref:sulfite exporter TauE/SafE family protein n=1 Tax=Bradyrhizobium sp. CSS354 TaxID=2699172 RepID=UPI0023AF6711|nr:sulfite exporter TauE/SafE family protein [Bradyrhizobium sp. CSS354]MDE5463651.1 TSUP family transporter [Bradyrhizobium sp. CSS354]
MRPADQKAASVFSVLRPFPAFATVCLLLFVLTLTVPSTMGSITSNAASWIVLFSALLSSIAGFAFSPIAGALLFPLLGEPLSVVQILLVSSIAQQLYCVWRLRLGIRLGECGPYLLGSVVTLPIGLLLLCKTSASTFLPFLGVLLISYGAFAIFKPDARAGANGWWGQVAVGALGGITGGLAAFPAAFVTMWCLIQGFDKHRARAIIQPFILVNQVLSLSFLMAVRPEQIMPVGAIRYAAPAVVGAYLGLFIFERVDTSTFNRIVGLFLIIAGLGFVISL